MNQEILDTHFHLWRAPGASYDWVDSAIDTGLHFVDRGTLPAEYTPTNYASEWRDLGFTPFVHVEAGASPVDAMRETTWLAAGGDSTRGRFVVYADLRSLSIRDDLVQQLAMDKRVVGVRQIVTWSPNPAITFCDSDIMRDPTWERGLEVLAELGLSFDLQIYPEQANFSSEIAARHRNVRFIINHTLLPLIVDGTVADGWSQALKALALHPNVAIKLGGLSLRNQEWSVQQAASIMAECVDIFGVDHTMFGTNAPVETARARASDVAEAADAVLAQLPAGERRVLARESALEWYSRPPL